MTEVANPFMEKLRSVLGERVRVSRQRGEITIETGSGDYRAVMLMLRDQPEFAFEQLIDLCGVDYLGFGEAEWDTTDVSSEGFSRAVEGEGPGRFTWASRPSADGPEKRFASVAHLLSVRHNRRVRVRCFADDNAMPVIDSVVGIYPVANWFEREAFDLFGIIYTGHPDLRRILTDYGFVGHPFRKDFPLIGNVEVLYDEAKGRVVYQPVSIEPRVGVPRTIREDSRRQQAQSEQVQVKP